MPIKEKRHLQNKYCNKIFIDNIQINDLASEQVASCSLKNSFRITKHSGYEDISGYKLYLFHKGITNPGSIVSGFKNFNFYHHIASVLNISIATEGVEATIDSTSPQTVNRSINKDLMYVNTSDFSKGQTIGYQSSFSAGVSLSPKAITGNLSGEYTSTEENATTLGIGTQGTESHSYPISEWEVIETTRMAQNKLGWIWTQAYPVDLYSFGISKIMDEKAITKDIFMKYYDLDKNDLDRIFNHEEASLKNVFSMISLSNQQRSSVASWTIHSFTSDRATITFTLNLDTVFMQKFNKNGNIFFRKKIKNYNHDYAIQVNKNGEFIHGENNTMLNINSRTIR